MRKSFLFYYTAFLCAMFLACPKPPPPPEDCVEVFIVRFAGPNEVPPTIDKARGLAFLYANTQTKTFHFRAFVAPLDSLTGLHFHLGDEVENGEVIVTLARFAGEFRVLPDKIMMQETDFTATEFENTALGWTFERFVEAARDSSIYCNAHTVNYRAGATRGQLLPFD